MNIVDLRLNNKVWILKIEKDDDSFSEERFGNGNVVVDGNLATIHAKSIAKKMLPCYYVKRDSKGRVLEEETFK